MSNISPERLAAIRHSARRWAEAWRDNSPPPQIGEPDDCGFLRMGPEGYDEMEPYCEETIRLCREWGLRDPAKWVYHWTGQRYVHRRPERFP
jgi:hypothetical protein